MFYFYCPNCKREEVTEMRPFHVYVHPRAGYGSPVYHCECPNCHNLDAGGMVMAAYSRPFRDYAQSVIEIYQGIRGFANPNGN